MVILKPVILCFVGYYLPGYKAGGPVRTIAHLVERLGHEFEVLIVTRDRDISDTKPYKDIEVDDWNKVGKAQVFYASSNTISLRGFAKLIRETPHDVLYLNSFFAFAFTGLPLLARWFRLVQPTPCLIAPRGEFSRNAIALKGVKKRFYKGLVKTMGLYRNLHWQASSDHEKEDIEREFGAVAQLIFVAPDLTPIVSLRPNVSDGRVSGPLRLVFLSRISPMKNLDFLLEALARVSAQVELSIYGPQEDIQYWGRCRVLIEAMPENVSIVVGGQVRQEMVQDVIARYDVLVLPSRGENFGHVVFESLTAATPVIVSDQTPWPSDPDGGLQVLELSKVCWADALEDWANYDQAELLRRRQAALNYAHRYLVNDEPLRRNRQLFNSVLGVTEDY
jgi:glycosyltransferase involved in cell wall biosynthesis